MESSSQEPTVVAISANLDRAEHEMRQLSKRVDSGMPMGELLRKKVALQRRIQRLRDEEEELRREELSQSLLKSKKERSLAAAKQKKKYMGLVGDNVSKRKPVSLPRKKKQEHGQERQNKGVNSNENDNSNVHSDSAVDGEDTQETLSITVSAGNFSNPLSTSRRSPPMRPHSDKVDRWRKNNGSCTSHEDARSENMTEGEGNIVEGLEGMDINMTVNIMQMVESTQWQTLNSNLRSDAARQARETKLEEAKKRQNQLKRRFDIVEGMFTRAIERRMRAMQRIAADPPADRLIGANALQHIPVGLLPGQLQQTAHAIVEGTMMRVKSPTIHTPVAAAAVSEVPQSKNFFITGVDAMNTTTTTRKKVGEGRSTSSGNENSLQEKEREEEDEDDDDTKEEGEEKEEGIVGEELLRQWRELGYTAVYLPASKQLVYPNESSRGGRRSVRKSYNPNSWMKLDPMPSVHLVQRRLPIEELLKQQEEQEQREEQEHQDDVAKSMENHWHLPSLRYGKK